MNVCFIRNVRIACNEFQILFFLKYKFVKPSNMRMRKCSGDHHIMKPYETELEAYKKFRQERLIPDKNCASKLLADLDRIINE